MKLNRAGARLAFVEFADGSFLDTFKSSLFHYHLRLETFECFRCFVGNHHHKQNKGFQRLVVGKKNWATGFDLSFLTWKNLSDSKHTATLRWLGKTLGEVWGWMRRKEG